MSTQPPTKSSGAKRTEKRIDHAKRAASFIAQPDHVAFHDRRLWDIRKKRDAQAEAIPEWETLRTLASQIKEHTLSNLSDYLAQFSQQAEANGVTVHWAADAEEHNQIVHQLLSSRGIEKLVKSKSMLTDECAMREYLEPRGIEVMETDLGSATRPSGSEPYGDAGRSQIAHRCSRIVRAHVGHRSYQ